MRSLTAAMTSTEFYVIAVAGFIIFLMLIFMIMMKMDISDLQRRYRKIVNGSAGENIEDFGDRENIRDEINRMNKLLERAITRVSVVRFNAFDDVSADMSFCVALLDDNNNGVIISTINGREESRNYAKEIVNGVSAQHKLTKEEEQALREASSGKSL